MTDKPPVRPSRESFTSSNSDHDLNRVGATGIRLDNRDELFIRRFLRAESIREGSNGLEANRQARATMADDFPKTV